MGTPWDTDDDIAERHIEQHRGRDTSAYAELRTDSTTNEEQTVASVYRPVAAATIRTKLDGLDGPVTTQQIVDHLAANGASPDELATVADLPDRQWSDYNAALAATSSGYGFRSS